MLSISEIAFRTGYSTATVSRALDSRFRDKVRPETREKILSFCGEVGYRPNFSARALSRGNTGTVGIVVPWIEAVTDSPTYGPLLGHLMDELKKIHRSLTLIPVVRDDGKSIHEKVLEAFQSSQVDAFLSMAAFLNTEILSAMRARNFPLVSFSMSSDLVQHLPGSIHCRIDSAPAIKSLFEHLRPYERIALLGVKSNSTRHEELAAMRQLDYFPIERGNFFFRATSLAAYEAVMQNWECLRQYQAIVCFNDQIAYGVCRALQTKGLTPGKDIAVTGFDDLEQKDPKAFITSISPPLQKLAALCVTRLQQVLEKETDIPAETSIPAELIIRKSSNLKIRS